MANVVGQMYTRISLCGETISNYVAICLKVYPHLSFLPLLIHARQGEVAQATNGIFDTLLVVMV